MILGMNEHVIKSWLDMLTWFGAVVGVVSVVLNVATIWLVHTFYTLYKPDITYEHLELNNS